MKNKKKAYLGTLLLCLAILAACGESKTTESSEGEKETVTEKAKLTIDETNRFQKVASFGASGAWWAQDVGGWDEAENDELSKRDYIGQLLFDPEKGIGLSSYRYNLGAGSADTDNSPKITDPWRRSESFEIGPKKYDWTKDANARYMLDQAVSYGVNDIYLFANSPLERLTKSGSAYGGNDNGNYSNLPEENYQAFAEYLLEVTEHFVSEGIPVKALSPINEPQWEWLEGQEGSHYSPEEVVAFAKLIYAEKEKHEKLNNVEISVPELGEWSNSSKPYYEAMLADQEFMDAYPNWDIHSYWSSDIQKEEIKAYFEENDVSVDLNMSEWTEMVNGKDVTMSSALNLANQVYEDLTILNVHNWQYWIAVSCYDYRDGLIYVDTEDHTIEPSKRLWAMGNFSKYIRPGAQRIAGESEDKEINTVAFKNADTDDVIVVMINNGFNGKELAIPKEWSIKEVIETSDEHELKVVKSEKEKVVLPRQSVTTIILSQA